MQRSACGPSKIIQSLSSPAGKAKMAPYAKPRLYRCDLEPANPPYRSPTLERAGLGVLRTRMVPARTHCSGDGLAAHRYQGENNVFQCRYGVPGDATLCGSAANRTGYGCFMRAMIDAWRNAWSAGELSQTSTLFPFGIVSLAGSTSEGHANATPE